MTRLADIWRDLRHAARVLGRARGFSLVVILSLGIGIALCIATTAVLNAYVVRSMPYPAAGRLYHVLYARDGERPPNGLEAIDWSSLSEVVEVAIASDPDVLYLTDGGFTEQAASSLVTTGFLEGLGVRPAIGRTFRDDDAVAGADRAAIISHALWRDRFGSDANVLGRRFRAYSAEDERATFTLTVVGVLPPGFWTARPIDVMLPLRSGVVTTYMVRLREGMPVAEAERRITQLAKSVASSIPQAWSGVRLRSVHEQYVAPLRPVLTAITTATVLVLAIVCANVVVLMLLRSTRREKEVALRLALGAGRAHVLRMLVAESCLLSFAALALGLALTAVTLRALAPLVEQNLGRSVPGGTSRIAIDETVLLTAVGIGLVVTFVLSLAPLLGSWRRDLFSSLRRDGHGSVGSPTGRRARSVLTAAEVAGSVALLVGCGVMVRTVVHLMRTDLGVQTTRVVRAHVTLPAQAYPTPSALAGFYDRLLERMDGPAGFADWPPLVPPLRHPLEVDAIDTADLSVGVMAVNGGFFDTLGIKIIEGRNFTSADRIGAEPVAIVSDALARRLWPNANAVGRRIRTAEEVSVRAPLASWRTIVGVTANIRQTVTDEDLRDIYLPFHQVPNRFASVMFRTDSPVATWLGTLRRDVSEINADVAVSDSPSLSLDANRQLAGPRFLASLLTGFAIFTALLAVLGLYGVVNYAVQQREREIAIRIALGATSTGITTLLVRHGAVLLAIGLACGLAGSRGVTRLLQTQLHGVSSFDALTVAATCVLLGTAGLVATWWPARRASRRNPVVALKGD